MERKYMVKNRGLSFVETDNQIFLYMYNMQAFQFNDKGLWFVGFFC